MANSSQVRLRSSFDAVPRKHLAENPRKHCGTMPNNMEQYVFLAPDTFLNGATKCKWTKKAADKGLADGEEA